jgi:hypothetical protein
MEENGKVSDSVKLHVKTEMDKEEVRCDKSYAIKLVERVVWGLIGLILTTVVVALLASIIKNQ